MVPIVTIRRVEAREKLMREYLAAWNARDPERVASFFAADAVYEDVGAGEVASGSDAIHEHVARVHCGFPDLQFELIRSAHGDEFTAGEWRSSMTHLGEFSGLAPTGRAVQSSGVDVATIDSGSRITHLASYYDGAAIMRALGLLPARGSRAERGLVGLASALSSVRRRGARQGALRTTRGSS
jgi:steroid delta-isomerase-like uncharacterized protein